MTLAEPEWTRTALLIVLDKFPRSLWRDMPAVFGQDIKVRQLAVNTLAVLVLIATPHVRRRFSRWRSPIARAAITARGSNWSKK